MALDPRDVERLINATRIPADAIQDIIDAARMPNDDLQAIINAARPPAHQPHKKVEPFSSTDGVEWQTWRTSFEITVRINGWNDQRARRELAAAMTGSAQLYVRDIPVGDDAVPVEDVPVLLAAYEQRFLPQAAGDLARIELREAKQKPDETVVGWHG